ncbi:MAG: LysR substrate-binding domain-containing protein [Burkholderiales bacterium]
MNKLMAMQTFVRVAESVSFSSAASQLGISVSAVAKMIARLEDELGTRLLERSTRRLAMNDDGREFYARAVQILNDVEDAEASLRRGARMPKGRIRIALPVLFARLTFLPRLAEFAARYPEIVLELRFDDRPGDLIEQGLDVAVVVGDLSDSRHVARVLNRGPRITAASARYLDRHGTPQAPLDLLQHNCITSITSPVWTFNDGGRIVDVSVSGNLVVTGGDAMRECALLGLGVVQSNWWTTHHDLDSGMLTPLLESYAVEGRPISVVYPSARHVANKVRVLIDFLVEITRLPAEVEERLHRSAQPARSV